MDQKYKDAAQKPKVRQYGDLQRPGKDIVINQKVFFALLMLCLIILLCLLFANILVTLLLPVIEIFVPDEAIKAVMFILFFAVFLLMAIPLVLSKVPWYVFSGREKTEAVDSKKYQKKLASKAQNVLRLYHLNEEYEHAIAPSYPEASIDHKRYVVEFLSKIVDVLNDRFSLKEDFSKLGIKFIVYGGCMELSRQEGLRINEANSLLYEAFKVIDSKPDIIGFYEAKKSYADSKEAIYLVGVGAHTMATVIRKYPVDDAPLVNGFTSWEILNDTVGKNVLLKQRVGLNCWTNIQTSISAQDELDGNPKEDIRDVRNAARYIIMSISEQLSPVKIIEKADFISVNFKSLNEALLLINKFLQLFSEYEEEKDYFNLRVENKCNILGFTSFDGEKEENMIEDVFDTSYDGEIVVDERVASALESSDYVLDFLGDKFLIRSGMNKGLYKLVFDDLLL